MTTNDRLKGWKKIYAGRLADGTPVFKNRDGAVWAEKPCDKYDYSEQQWMSNVETIDLTGKEFIHASKKEIEDYLDKQPSIESLSETSGSFGKLTDAELMDCEFYGIRRRNNLIKCKICPEMIASWHTSFNGVCYVCYHANRKREALGLPPLQHLTKKLPYYG